MLKIFAEYLSSLFWFSRILLTFFQDDAPCCKVNGLVQSVDDLTESVTFIKDNAVTKDEFNSTFNSLDRRVTRIEANMVTKSYLDEKIGGLRGDMVTLTRKEDNKVNAVVDALDKENTLPKKRIEEIRSHHVFPAQPTISTSQA